jgi:sigma-B regulation protein RsbU (phosphoserine phosphatase)
MTPNFADESDRLKKAMNELVALNKIAGAVNVLMAVEDITQTIVDHCIKHTRASQGAVFLLKEEDQQVDKFKTFVREFSSSSDQIPFHINESLTGWMIKNKTMFVCNDPDNDKHFSWMHLSKIGINSIMAAPLFAKGGLIGSIILFNKKEEDGFTEDDKRFLGIVGSQTANVIENARLREQEMQLLAMKEELNLARSIQKKFLPDKGIDFDGGAVRGINHPARDVGGDYFDIYQLDENRIFLSLGDVSGKGVPAALLMANAQAVLRSRLTGPAEIDLAFLASELNHLICEFTEPEQYITTTFGIFDIPTKSFSYVNAGHEPPLPIKRNNEKIEVPVSDLVVGVIPGIDYHVHRMQLNSGEMLIIFTDGITEAFDENDVQFGSERLSAYLKNSLIEEIDTCCQGLFQEIKNFRGQAVQSDDITYIILKLR